MTQLCSIARRNLCLTNQLILSNRQPRAIAHPTTIFVNENRFAFYYEISSGVGDEWSEVGVDERERKEDEGEKSKSDTQYLLR